MSKFLRFALVATLMLAMGALQAFAQSTTTGAIGGVVTNPADEVIPNATVTVRNVETNKEATAQTDDEGRFRVVNLDPGNYTVTINATGFSLFTQERVVVEVGQVTSISTKLSVGPIQTNTVEVTSEAPVINTSQQDFSNNVNQTSINELPINGRRWSAFALLTPGSTPDGTFGLVSFRGISGLLNNNTVDGGDNNQAFFSEERGRTRISYVVSQAAIREFQVNTSNYSAEYGRAAGGVVNAVTKSGTNEFHGQGFYYNRNNRFGARNPKGFLTTFDAATGTISINPFKPVDVRHQFGGNIGGPIVKNKAFFFFNYDQQKRNFPGLAIFSASNFLTTVNRATTGAGLKNPTLRNLSDAQINQGLAFLTNETGPVPRRGDQYILLPKFDWHITQNETFTATYNRLRWKSPSGIQTQPTNTFGRAAFGDDFVNVDSLNLRLASTISATEVNEFRFQWGRDNEFEFSTPPLAGEPTTGPGGRSPDVFITSGIEFGRATFLERAAFPDETRFQFADTVTLTRGNHTIKFGGDINRVRDILDNLRFGGGAYSYNNINDFIIDLLNWQTPGGLRVGANPVTCSASTRTAGRCYTSNYTQAFGPSRFQFNTTDYNLFIQDDWRFSPRLTFNLGLRYEYEALPKPQIPNFRVTSPQAPDQALRNFSPTAKFPNDHNNFGPRIGFAYDMTGDGRNSLRGGFGVYYGRLINSTISNAITNTGIPGISQISTSVAPATGPIFPNILSTQPAGNGDVQFFAERFQLPMIEQADLIFEHQIARNTVVSVSYLFSHGKYLPNFVDTNLSPPSGTRTYVAAGGPLDGQSIQVPYFAGARPNANFGRMTEIRSDVSSNYHALVLQANRRLTKGLQFQTSYTLSKAVDSGQTSTTFTTNNAPFNAFDQSFERGRSNFDIRHKFVASIVYNPHWFEQGNSRVGRAIFNGFTFSPVISLYSGRAFSATLSGNPPASFGTNQAGGINGSGGSTRIPLFGRNSFSMPPTYNVDFRMSRRFHLRESMNLEILGEFFNIFNHTQVSNVNSVMYRTSSTATVNFDSSFNSDSEAGGTNFRERQFQWAIRFEF